MNREDFENKVVESANYEWLQALTATFNYPHIDIERTFEGIINIYDFVKNQVVGWESYEEKLPNSFQDSKTFFISLKTQLETLVDNENYQKNGHWQNILSTINSPANSSKNFVYDCPEVPFLVELSIKNYDFYIGAYYYITNTISGSNIVKNSSCFTGALLAFDFKNKDVSGFYSRKKAEEKSIVAIHENFQKQISDSKNDMLDAVKQSKESVKKYYDEIDELRKTKEKSFNSWYNASREQYSNFHEEANQKRNDLEITYQNLLKLKAPAEYWKERGEKLKKEGRFFMFWLMGLIFTGIILLYILLWFSPEDMLTSIFSNDKGKAIRWSIIFITFISLLFVGIRALMKAMYSSFHLARDAEEREQLTYVYLALSKDSNVESEDRQLILQSLFSRSDSGLLKDDSGPTMPGVNNIISGNLK